MGGSCPTLQARSISHFLVCSISCWKKKLLMLLPNLYTRKNRINGGVDVQWIYISVHTISFTENSCCVLFKEHKAFIVGGFWAFSVCNFLLHLDVYNIMQFLSCITLLLQCSLTTFAALTRNLKMNDSDIQYLCLHKLSPSIHPTFFH